MKLDYQLWENYIDVSIKTISKGHLTLLPSRRISPKNLLFLSPLRWFAPISRELKCVDVLGSKVFWRGGGENWWNSQGEPGLDLQQQLHQTWK